MRVIVADDHPIVLSALSDVLRQAGYTVLATARGGDEALNLINELRPDIAVLDVVMPGRTGIEILSQLRQQKAQVAVVILTGVLDDDTLVQAVRLGVNGLVLKESATDILLRCLEAVGRGEQWIDREAMARALQLLARERSIPSLTPRETEILALIGKGMKNRMIAEELGMSEGTVKAHLSNIFDKLGVGSRSELLIRTRDLGLI